MGKVNVLVIVVREVTADMPATCYTNGTMQIFPYKISPLEPQLNKQLMAHFKGEKKGFCKVGPKEWLLPMSYAVQAVGYYSFKPKKDDIWIATFPRSGFGFFEAVKKVRNAKKRMSLKQLATFNQEKQLGTTWCQELVWLLNNNLDYELAATLPLDRRFPFFEFATIQTAEFHEEIRRVNNYSPEAEELMKYWRTPGYEIGKTMSSPRHFKTHLPFSLLPPDLLDTCKVIYLARNPLDVAVSYYHHNRLLKAHDYCGDFEQYWQYFENGLLTYCPYWPHIQEGWDHRNHPNLLFIFYEDLIKDLPKSIIRISNFLNKSINEDEVSRLTNYLHIDNFRKTLKLHNVEVIGMINEGEQGFIRKGKIGDNEDFTEEIKAQALKWIEENLSKTDIQFPINMV